MRGCPCWKEQAAACEAAASDSLRYLALASNGWALAVPSTACEGTARWGTRFLAVMETVRYRMPEHTTDLSVRPECDGVARVLEARRYDWGRLDAVASAAQMPAIVAELAGARDHSRAHAAYWRIDNGVVVQGLLYEAALPVLRIVLLELAGCSSVARPFLLELAVQICSGTSQDGLERRCRSELAGALNVLLYWVENGSLEERIHCVDLLGLCASECPVVFDRVSWYLRYLAQNAGDKGLAQLAATTLEDTHESSCAVTGGEQGGSESGQV